MARSQASETQRRGAPPGHGRGRGGFTLLELVIVLAVVGVTVGIALPRIDVVQYQVESAMQTVGTSLMALQRYAVLEHHDIVLAFDTINGTIRVHEDTNDDGQIEAGEKTRLIVLDPGIRFGRGSLPAMGLGDAAVSFTKRQDGMPALTFHADGSASEEGGFYLSSIRSQTNPQFASDGRAVRVDRSTGRPTWYRFEVSSSGTTTVVASTSTSSTDPYAQSTSSTSTSTPSGTWTPGF